MTDTTPTPTPAFIVTKEHKRFVEFCDACRQYQYIGLCYGKPGVGKTLSARQYARWDLVQVMTDHAWRSSEPFPIRSDLADCDTIFYTASVANSPRRIEQDIDQLRLRFDGFKDEVIRAIKNDHNYAYNDRLAPATHLILVDEADRLKQAGLEQLRDIYDQGNIGLVLIGMPGIEKRLSRYPQLYSRVGFAHHFKPLSEAEVHFILQHKWSTLGLNLDLSDFTDAEAIAAIIQVTAGNFRLIHRLFTQIERILEINQLHTITKEVVETARANLVIGYL
jgi:DNA transposition AAA+ family ATPase